MMYRQKCLKQKINTCFACGSTGDLEVHHIDGDRTNNALENLVPICKDCHKSIHTSYSDPRNHVVKELRGKVKTEKKQRQLNITLTDEMHAKLKEVKGDRSWREALLEEFDV